MNYVANKQITIKGVTLKPGDPFDASTLPEHKIRQFLNLRMLRPAPEPAPAPTKTPPD